jgi:hypothetical protein
MEQGLSLGRIKIVAHSEVQGREGIKAFSQRKALYQPSKPQSQAQIEYDVFRRWNSLKKNSFGPILLFIYSSLEGMIDIGSPWQPQIFESLDKC